MARMEIIGAFGLTEPLVGSGTGGGLTTTAKREGDTWILNGQKKWIGNATWSDVTIIWAKDVDDGQVRGFIVENKKTSGFKTEKIEGKIALRVVQNALITMEDCRGCGGEPVANGYVIQGYGKGIKNDPCRRCLGIGWLHDGSV